MSQRDTGHGIIVFVVTIALLLFFVLLFAARTVACDQSSCPGGGEPRMMRGVWQSECVCVEKPVRR